jgi:hypothetical protein
MSHPLARMLLRLLHRPQGDAQMQQLTELLGLPIEEVAQIATDPRLGYRHFSIRKRGGGRRQIAAPSSPLKLLQRRLLHRYLAQQPTHEAATAFRPRSSIGMHARLHLGQAIVLTVDLADFFPATAARRVRSWFRELGWSGDALDTLMRLCTYRGGLPQGAPTSPALSNLVNRQLDVELSELAAHTGARYSRYADDLAFSWSGDFQPNLFCRQAEEVLRRFGYRIQPEKSWRVQHAEARPEITGLVLDGWRLRLPQRIVRRIRQLKSRWFGRSAHQQQQLEGYRGLVKMLKRHNFAAALLRRSRHYRPNRTSTRIDPG